MKNPKILLDIFNQTLTTTFPLEKALTLNELALQDCTLTYNDNFNNVFDAVIDLVVYTTGAIWKIAKLTNVYPKDLATSTEEETVIMRITKWNEERNLNIFNFRREFCFVIEEIYESVFNQHQNAHEKSSQIVDKYFTDLVKENTKNFKVAQKFFIALYKNYCQIGHVFAKYFEKENFWYYVNQVMDANDQKGKTTDATGKLIKDNKTFVAPETSFVKKNN